MWVCMWLQVHVYTQCMWMPEADVGCLPWLFVYWDRVLWFTTELINQYICLGSLLTLGILYLHLLRAGIIGRPLFQLFQKACKSLLKSASLEDSWFLHWAISFTLKGLDSYICLALLLTCAPWFSLSCMFLDPPRCDAIAMSFPRIMICNYQSKQIFQS